MRQPACQRPALPGFGHAGFWLLGFAFEGTYLYALVSSPRFRNVVDAGQQQLSEDAVERERGARPEASPRRAGAPRKAGRPVRQNASAGSRGPDLRFVVEGNREALRKLQWLYLKVDSPAKHGVHVCENITFRNRAARGATVEVDSGAIHYQLSTIHFRYGCPQNLNRNASARLSCG